MTRTGEDSLTHTNKSDSLKAKTLNALDSGRRNCTNLIWWRDRFLYRLAFPLLFRGWNGVKVIDEEWDNLIILDACRYDQFKALAESSRSQGDMQYRVSRGSATRQFLTLNFGSGFYDDVVYVAANPFVNKLLAGRFHEIVPVWRSGWDEKEGTVLPESVAEAAEVARKRYPDKRLIVHFMQPHYPFIGYRGFDTSLTDLRESVMEDTDSTVRRGVRDSPLVMCAMRVYSSLQTNRGPFIEAYRNNLRIAFESATNLAAILGGKTVITADHGEAFGEKIHPLLPVRVYGHLDSVGIDSLIRVPWFVVGPTITHGRQA